jgi:hypothetical protein
VGSSAPSASPATAIISTVLNGAKNLWVDITECGSEGEGFTAYSADTGFFAALIHSPSDEFFLLSSSFFEVSRV